MVSPDYEQLNTALEDAGAVLDAAEAHGILCGLFCARGTDSAERWIKELLGDFAQEDGPTVASRDVMRAVYAATLADLEAAHFTFQPLLPPDGEAVASRAEALGRWCQGLLLGLGLGGVADTARLAPQTLEVLHDLGEISRAGTCSSAGSEDDEQALFELLEFVRVSVYLLRQAFTGRDPGPG